CVFCKLPDNCPDKYGEKIVSKTHSLTLHYFCLLMSSGVYQRGEEDEGIYGFLVEDVRKEMERSSKLRCGVCKKNGASVGCSVKACSKKVHFPCGQQKGFLFQFTGLFPSFCLAHRPTQTAADSSRLSGPFSCSVCLDLLEPVLSYSVLKCPCCNSSWFHRDCVQNQAHSAGMFFFRCTICNNKDKFQQEMLRMGIHIPEKDASWELEENAYSELLQVYQHCDVKKCCCRRGRGFSQPDSKWEIVLCQYCGSSGTHRSCSSLRGLAEEWVCPECRIILNETGSLSRNIHSMCPPSVTKETNKPRVKRHHPSSRFSPVVLKRQSLPARSSAVMLRELAAQVIQFEHTRVFIRGSSVFDAALLAVRKRNFSPRHAVTVFFNKIRKEQVSVNHGNRRKFLRLLVHYLQNCAMFEGFPHARNLTLDSQALSEDLYFEAGRLIALSLVHGGPPPACFSRVLYHCLLDDFPGIQLCVEDLGDVLFAGHVTRIKEAQSVDELQVGMCAAVEMLPAPGYLRPVSRLCDKELVVQDLLNFYLITRLQMPLQRFREGLKTLGVLDQIQKFPEVFSPVFCGRPEKLTAEKMGDLFTVHYSSDENRVTVEMTVVEFWRQYLQDCEDGNCASSLEMILIFATSADTVPAIGFTPEPCVEFIHEQPQSQGMYPEANPSFNCILLPVVSCYDVFRRNMDYAICQDNCNQFAE
ncbi:G2E3 ligase, partial [Amia calva]|nr:G2E3 ligase [Amia calva]